VWHIVISVAGRGQQRSLSPQKQMRLGIPHFGEEGTRAGGEGVSISGRCTDGRSSQMF